MQVMLFVVLGATGLTYWCVVVLTCGPATLHAHTAGARLGNALAVIVFTSLVRCCCCCCCCCK